MYIQKILILQLVAVKTNQTLGLSGREIAPQLQNHSEDSSGLDDEAMFLHDSSDGVENLPGFDINLQLENNDYSIVKFPTNKKPFYRHYVAKIIDTYDSNFQLVAFEGMSKMFSSFLTNLTSPMSNLNRLLVFFLHL